MSTLFNKATVQIFISGEERNARRAPADPDATCGRQAPERSFWRRCSGLPLIARGHQAGYWRPDEARAPQFVRGRASKEGRTPKLREAAPD